MSLKNPILCIYALTSPLVERRKRMVRPGSVRNNTSPRAYKTAMPVGEIKSRYQQSIRAWPGGALAKSTPPRKSDIVVMSSLCGALNSSIWIQPPLMPEGTMGATSLGPRHLGPVPEPSVANTGSRRPFLRGRLRLGASLRTSPHQRLR